MPTLIERIHLRNFLSFGPESEPVELGPLNVLIGPNASGKSNFLEAFSLLQSTSGDLVQRVVQGGGISEWVWKGGTDVGAAEVAVEVEYRGHTLMSPEGEHLGWTAVSSELNLSYQLGMALRGGRLELESEQVRFRPNRYLPEGKLLYEYQGVGIGQLHEQKRSGGDPQGYPVEVDAQQSILSQRKDPRDLPQITYLGAVFSQIRLYRDWNLGRNAPARQLQPADQAADFLNESASNLAMVLPWLRRTAQVREAIGEYIRRFHPSFEEFEARALGGYTQLFLREKGLREDMPATRLSDGTLRYLALLAVLCHPEPPPLVCIEEPELGLHPDIIPTIAELLVSASERTQLIVTTHSDMLISALSDHPEAVVVCDRDEHGTHLRRLEADKLEEWLKDYSLGDLWLKGQIGGTRW